jgi:glycosyltransferase involved in cell wall biosynthesis
MVPRVSVVLCFLNEERFLGEAVDSVLTQTYSDWELLLVDDGSRDRSTALAQQYAKRHPRRIFYIDHPEHANLGLSASRNVGIGRARGPYVCFIDADDAWFPRKLEEQAAILDRNREVAMVIGASQYWRSWSGERGAEDVVIPVGAESEVVIAPPGLMTRLYPLGQGAAPPPSDLMVRREALNAVGGFEASFRGPLMLYEDQAFLSKIYRRYPVYVASACWDRYRVRPDSIMARTSEASLFLQVRLHFLMWLQQDLRRTGAVSAEVQRALRQAIRQTRGAQTMTRAKRLARRILPGRVVHWLKHQRRTAA